MDNLGIGGTELNAVRTAEHFDRSRVELSVAVLGADGELRGRYDRAGIPVFDFPLRNLYGRSAWREGRRFARFVKERRVDVVHCHDMYSNVFGAIWGRLGGARGIVASRRWWNTLPARRHRIGNRLAYRLAGRVLANSEAIARSLAEDEGVPARKITVVPNFVEPAAFDAPTASDREEGRQALGAEPADFVIGIIARLAPVKDHATLLRALALVLRQHPQVRLVIVGEGPEERALRLLAGELGVAARVTFAGLRPNRPNLHHLFDVSVLSSLSEGFPNSVVEAMAAARPVVATAVGGTRDAVRDGVTGTLVPPGEPERMAAAIARLIADPATAERQGLAGREAASQTYSQPAAMARLLTLYEEVMAQ